MIEDYDNICDRIRAFGYYPINQPFEMKVDFLQTAMRESVKSIGEKILAGSSRIHLGFSGGLDSSVMLFLFLEQNFPVTAWTICMDEKHPDAICSQKLTFGINGKDLLHKLVTISPVSEDISESNKVLGEIKERADSYFYLLKTICRETPVMVNCDCIDELLGGYYAHQRPENLPVYHNNLSLEENRKKALDYFNVMLIENHLSVLNKFSNHFNIKVNLPYATELVMGMASSFRADELVDDENRKKPMLEIAKRIDVPEYILLRRKYGLCDAMKSFS